MLEFIPWASEDNYSVYWLSEPSENMTDEEMTALAQERQFRYRGIGYIQLTDTRKNYEDKITIKVTHTGQSNN